jgi:hypothetical protein
MQVHMTEVHGRGADTQSSRAVTALRDMDVKTGVISNADSRIREHGPSPNPWITPR